MREPGFSLATIGSSMFGFITSDSLGLFSAQEAVVCAEASARGRGLAGPVVCVVLVLLVLVSLFVRGCAAASAHVDAAGESRVMCSCCLTVATFDILFVTHPLRLYCECVLYQAVLVWLAWLSGLWCRHWLHPQYQQHWPGCSGPTRCAPVSRWSTPG